MIFLTYDFVWFALIFFPLYYLAFQPGLRLTIIIIGGIIFQLHYGGWISVVSVAALAIVTFLAGSLGSRQTIIPAIALCVATLAVFKYTPFLAAGVVGPVAPDIETALRGLAQSFLPATIPLGISFFTFEFVHYLADLRRGHPPIRRFADFLAFALFWPTMVAGPIKRYQQFIPALRAGLARPTATDTAVGLTRIAIGFAKKWAADNLTGWIELIEPQFFALGIGTRWLFVAALSFRILLDFSGYSDMAIGFARIMGIVVPENFNWPYIARSPIEFWRRWHISLSLWIRDYIYIPLGGNRLGLPRRIVNGLTAMALCGLWHGPDWSFVVWGLYHGAGLSVASLLERGLQPLLATATRSIPSARAPRGAASFIGSSDFDAARIVSFSLSAICWACTMVFVGIGWLLFFYPLEKAVTMAAHLFLW